MAMTDRLHVVVQLVLLVPATLLVTFAATRLLGVRRSWTANVAAGTMGVAGGSLGALLIAEGHVSAPGFLRNVLLLSFVITMVSAVGADLLARPGAVVSQRPTGILPSIPRPLDRVRAGWQDARRTREIVAIVSRNGFGPALGLRARRRRRQEMVHHLPNEERVRATLEQCGGMFVKLGQLASTRTEIFPPGVIAVLSRLQSDVTPVPPEAMRPLLEEELGATMEEVFAEFDWSPVAAASIGQVYRARLRTGEAVIVKAQRPEVAEVVRRDSHVLLRLASMVEHNTPFGDEHRVHELARQFTNSLEQELDFRIEARNTETIRRNMADQPRVRIPRVYDALSTARVMVQERLDGVTVADCARVARLAADPQVLADALLRAALTQMMVNGLFHADLHPGNVMVLDDGTLGLVDFGNTGELDPLWQASLRPMLVATGLRDATMPRQAVEEITEIGEEVDPDALERALSRFLSQHVSGGSIGVSAINDLMQLLTTFGLQVPIELTVFSRALVILEGTLATLVPGYQLTDHARELAEEWAVIDPGGSMDEIVKRELLGLVPVLRQLPRRVDRVGDQLERGNLTVRVSLFSNPSDTTFVSKLVNRALLGFLGAVLGIISAVLLSASGGVGSDGSELVRVLGALGLIGGVVLMMRVAAAILREGLN